MPQFLHKKEKEQFRKLFKKNKINRFEERFLILKIFLKTERHVNFNELLDIIKQEGFTIEPIFVQKTMDLMCNYGFAYKYCFRNKEVRYEHLHLGQHHDHMICIKCNEIFEFQNAKLEKLQIQIANKYKFHVLQHRMDIYGICSKCMTNPEEAFLLSNAPQGEQVIISNFYGGKKSNSRLSSMGLRKGDIINIIINSGKGHLVISVGYKRIILCRAFAQKITVKLKFN